MKTRAETARRYAESIRVPIQISFPSLSSFFTVTEPTNQFLGEKWLLQCFVVFHAYHLFKAFSMGHTFLSLGIRRVQGNFLVE